MSEELKQNLALTAAFFGLSVRCSTALMESAEKQKRVMSTTGYTEGLCHFHVLMSLFHLSFITNKQRVLCNIHCNIVSLFFSL